MFAVMVKPAMRKLICISGLVWVKDDHHEFYVSVKERGLWPTKAEAERMIAEPWEIAVEVHNCNVTGLRGFLRRSGGMISLA